MREIAKTRSVVSIGISCFKEEKQNEEPEEVETEKKRCTKTYSVTSFDILSLRKDDYILEEDAHTFLRNHGFDFERQKSQGIPYTCPTEFVSVYVRFPLFGLLIFSHSFVEYFA